MGKKTERTDAIKKVKDSVCGMTTQSPEAYIDHEYQGDTFYFCSEHCQKKFKDDPDKYLQSEPEAESGESEPEDQGTGKIYTCPMHPEVEEDHPGDCPKCGMAMESKTIDLEAEDNREYLVMRNRFWVSASVSLPLMVIAMRDFFGLWVLSPMIAAAAMSFSSVSVIGNSLRLRTIDI